MFATELSIKDEQSLKEALNWLYEKGFFFALTQGTVSKWRDENEKAGLEQNISFDSGLTKYVIIIKGVDWVLKVNDPFIAEARNRDFVKIEAEVYEEAYKAGFSQYFAPTYNFGEIAGISVIIQRRVDTDENYFFDEMFDYCKQGFDRDDYVDDDCYYEDISEDVNGLDAVGAFEAIFCDVPEQIERIIKKYDLGDFHSANFGLMNSEPVLIDFCGY